MIEIQLSTAVALYSTVLALIIVVIWTYTEVTVRRTHRFLAKQFLWHCVFCGYSYLDESAEDISRCPRCQSFNSVEDKRAREVPARPRFVEELTEGPEPKDAGHRPRNPSRRHRPTQRRRGGRRRR